jgi:hypothetical protein
MWKIFSVPCGSALYKFHCISNSETCLLILKNYSIIRTLASYDRHYDLVVRVLGYRSGSPGSIPGTTRKKKVVGLERGPLSLVSTPEELFDRKVAALSRKSRIRP